MIYVLLIVIILLIGLLYFTYSIMARVDRTYDIVNKWAIYYVCKEQSKGNNEPFDFIFPNEREMIEEKIKQEECHIDKEKE